MSSPMSHALMPFILALSSLILCGCGDVPKPQEKIVAELPECRIGDSCVFRPDFGSALVFTNLDAYHRFRRSKLETPDESFHLWDWDGTGDWTALPKNARIQLLKYVDSGLEGGVEAMVEADNYRPSPDGIGMMGIKIAGHKVWLDSKLAPLSRWQRN